MKLLIGTTSWFPTQKLIRVEANLVLSGFEYSQPYFFFIGENKAEPAAMDFLNAIESAKTKIMGDALAYRQKLLENRIVAQAEGLVPAAPVAETKPVETKPEVMEEVKEPAAAKPATAKAAKAAKTPATPKQDVKLFERGNKEYSAILVPHLKTILGEGCLKDAAAKPVIEAIANNLVETKAIILIDGKENPAFGALVKDAHVAVSATEDEEVTF